MSGFGGVVWVKTVAIEVDTRAEAELGGVAVEARSCWDVVEAGAGDTVVAVLDGTAVAICGGGWSSLATDVGATSCFLPEIMSGGTVEVAGLRVSANAGGGTGLMGISSSLGKAGNSAGQGDGFKVQSTNRPAWPRKPIMKGVPTPSFCTRQVRKKALMRASKGVPWISVSPMQTRITVMY